MAHAGGGFTISARKFKGVAREGALPPAVFIARAKVAGLGVGAVFGGVPKAAAMVALLKGTDVRDSRGSAINEELTGMSEKGEADFGGDADDSAVASSAEHEYFRRERVEGM